jgi:prepilin-type N-terminal cleavage/methylation domain-containing protein
MSNARRLRRGFTLIEALVATVILGIGISAVLTAISSVTRAEARAREQDFVQLLAERKYEELVATEADLSAPTDGNFEDEGVFGYRWNMESADSGIEGLQSITVSVEPEDALVTDVFGEAVGLVYIPPTTTVGGTAP